MTTVIKELSIGLAHWHINISKSINSHIIRFALLGSADKNGRRARSVTEIILEARSAAIELVATPTAATVIAKADVVGSRQTSSTRGGDAGRSTMVYLTGTSAELVNSLGTVRNNCV